MIRKLILTLIVGVMISQTGCASGIKKSEGVLGTVRYIESEGGFYGIVSGMGKKYDPMNLPEKFQVDGLEVEFWPKPFDGFTSFHMWGELVELEKIKKV